MCLDRKIDQSNKGEVTYLAGCIIKDQIWRSHSILELQIRFKILTSTWPSSFPISTSMVLSCHACPPSLSLSILFLKLYFQFWDGIPVHVAVGVSGINPGYPELTILTLSFWILILFKIYKDPYHDRWT